VGDEWVGKWGKGVKLRDKKIVGGRGEGEMMKLTS
jgi:hypothetical protein